MVDMIDRFLIINLDERKDRLESIADQCREAGIPEDRMTRISAVKEAVGWRGCTKSHIGALQLAKANRWKTVMVLEDDVDFTQGGGYLKDTVRECMLNRGAWDVVMMNYGLSCRAPTGTLEERGRGALRDYFPVTRVTDKFYRVKGGAATSSCYLITLPYYDTLIANYREGLDLGTPLDLHWETLQRRDRWLFPAPPVGAQREDYSDILGRVVNYGF